jgi:hypothetical protein
LPAIFQYVLLNRDYRYHKDPTPQSAAVCAFTDEPVETRLRKPFGNVQVDVCDLSLILPGLPYEVKRVPMKSGLIRRSCYAPATELWDVIVVFCNSADTPLFSESLDYSCLSPPLNDQGKFPMKLHRIASGLLLAFWVLQGAFAAEFRVGHAKREITPAAPVPMWGYGARGAALSTGVRDPLFIRTVVIDVGSDKLAIVGMDLGRSPTDAMLPRIRNAVREASGVNFLLISGSHTHHGPVVELLDEPDKGRGRFDDAVRWSQSLETAIIESINQAAASVQPARLGWGSKSVTMNRNRHTKREPTPVDSELAVIRFDNLEGTPLAVVVNYAAHPTMLDSKDLRFSADWPGAMAKGVEEALQAPCVFMQGACGDLSCQTNEQSRGVDAFGAALARQVIETANAIATKIPQRPRIRGIDDTFEFETRLPFSNPLTRVMFSTAFFPELANASMTDELLRNRIRPNMTTILLNQELALVGCSGEFFCEHSLRLKERARDIDVFFFGYCNGHHMYFPTIEAAAEGGYGADSAVSWVSPGAGESMMDAALINIYTLTGKFLLDRNNRSGSTAPGTSDSKAP